MVVREKVLLANLSDSVLLHCTVSYKLRFFSPFLYQERVVQHMKVPDKPLKS